MSYKTIGKRVVTEEREIRALTCDDCGKQVEDNRSSNDVEWFSINKTHKLDYYIYDNIDLCPECGAKRLAGLEFKEECTE